jgi:hypothetical protein
MSSQIFHISDEIIDFLHAIKLRMGVFQAADTLVSALHPRRLQPGTPHPGKNVRKDDDPKKRRHALHEKAVEFLCLLLGQPGHAFVSHCQSSEFLKYNRSYVALGPCGGSAVVDSTTAENPPDTPEQALVK